MPIKITKPLAEIKAGYKVRIDAEAGTHILKSVPSWKQNNLTARYLELVRDGTSASPEGVAIDAIWEWIKTVRTASNVANSAIADAATAADIRAAYQTFKDAIVNGYESS
jgi:hypothetical protein